MAIWFGRAKMVITLDQVTLLLILVLMAVLSVYKLFQIYRYRNDPVKRKRLLNTTQVYPKKIKRWILDENYNEKHGIGRASNQGCK
jgi:hypothetical protein